MSSRSEQDPRTGNSLEEFQRDLADNLCYERGTTVESASAQDVYWTLAVTIRDRLAERPGPDGQGQLRGQPEVRLLPLGGVHAGAPAGLNKLDLAAHALATTGVVVDPASLFDVMVKRLHEYKRKLLKLLHVVTLYNRIKADPAATVTPCTVIFGARAAPSYHEAKRVIKLINAVAAVVNADPHVAGRIKVVFIPDYNVSVSELVVAAGNVSEQISLAGKEASGTGNMKLALNGAVTVGTLDGANIEIRDRVGAGNFFLFGVTADQAVAVRQAGYTPRAYYQDDAELKAAIDALASGAFSGGDRDAFEPVISSLLNWDEYLVLADYRSYIDCHDQAVRPAWTDEDRWTRMSILNTARSGYFSSDRTVRDYCRDIWHAEPVPVSPYVPADPEAPARKAT
jgi:glycogen phosphorylase